MCQIGYQLYINLNKIKYVPYLCFLVLLHTNTYITVAYCAILFRIKHCEHNLY